MMKLATMAAITLVVAWTAVCAFFCGKGSETSAATIQESNTQKNPDVQKKPEVPNSPEDDAILEFKKHHGWVVRDDKAPGKPVIYAGFPYSMPTDETLKPIKNFKQLQSFSVQGTVYWGTISVTD